jgi:hypothetical protein
MKICTRCGSHDVRRSRRRAYEHLLTPLTSKRPYRCDSCQARMWAVPEEGHGPHPPDPPNRPSRPDLNLTDLDK